jgi:hypothetical protein
LAELWVSLNEKRSEPGTQVIGFGILIAKEAMEIRLPVEKQQRAEDAARKDL